MCSLGNSWKTAFKKQTALTVAIITYNESFGGLPTCQIQCKLLECIRGAPQEGLLFFFFFLILTPIVPAPSANQPTPVAPNIPCSMWPLGLVHAGAFACTSL